MGKIGSIRTNWLYLGKLIVFGQIGCIWASSVVLGQIGCIWAKMVEFGQIGCI